ncbi:MAG: MFS transporter [Lachnospiraceae bacterium]|nr:MFS transporter [Lachnospiraceae bacterium]
MKKTSGQQHSQYYTASIIITMCLMMTLLFMDIPVTVSLAQIYKDLANNNTFLETFIVTGPFAIGLLWTAVLTGLCQKFSKKKLLIIHCLIGSLAAALSAFSPNMYIFALCRAVTGFASEPCIALINAIIFELFQDNSDDSAKILSYTNMFGCAYSVLLSALCGKLANLNWRFSQLCNLIPLAGLIFFVHFIPEKPPGQRQQKRIPKITTVCRKAAAC